MSSIRHVAFHHVRLPPFLVKIFGGFQSACTLHFFAANFLVLFLFVQVAMVTLAGFVKRCRAMITG
jgi:thiosulfate reductase cytochrome b subunit